MVVRKHGSKIYSGPAKSIKVTNHLPYCIGRHGSTRIAGLVGSNFLAIIQSDSMSPDKSNAPIRVGNERRELIDMTP